MQDLMSGAEKPAKRTLSPEHKAKLAAGRDAARTRGRPAVKTETGPMPVARTAEITSDQMLETPEQDYAALANTLTRQSRLNGDNSFDIPQQGRISGWDYQYWPTHVMGQEIDPSETVNYQLGGWIPVPAKHFPQLCPPGWARPTIDRQGQRMYMRPMRLSQEARAEQTRLAHEQKFSKLAQAQAGDSGRDFAPRANEGIKTELRPLLE